MCGRYASYATGDHEDIRRSCDPETDTYVCADCRRRLATARATAREWAARPAPEKPADASEGPAHDPANDRPPEWGRR